MPASSRCPHMPRRRCLPITLVLAIALLAGSLATSGISAEAALTTPAFPPAIDRFAAYDGQTTCGPTPRPGAVNLGDLLERTYPVTSSLGTVRACSVGGRSEHKEGRAFDWAVKVGVPSQRAMAEEFLTWLLATDEHGNPAAMARRLGIMYMIWNRQIWKAYDADKGWQAYTGASPHTEHIHFSLSRDGGNARTSWYVPIPEPAPTTPAPGLGYWVPTVGGATLAFAAPNHGGLPRRPSFPVVGMAALPSGSGYWQVASDGGIFSFGAARFLGSTGGIVLAQPIVGMAATPSGRGYWLVASDGGVFTYGDAAFKGSTGTVALTRPIVGMASTPSGAGYWLVASDGGIFAFGDAAFAGSTGDTRLDQPIVGMTTNGGGGYLLVAADGGIFAFGGATFRGSTGGTRLDSPIRAIATTATGNGYWMVATDGGIFSFGDAPFQGSASYRGATVVGIARYR